MLDLVDKMAANTEDKDAVKTLREGYGNLADAVANLPLVVRGPQPEVPVLRPAAGRCRV